MATPEEIADHFEQGIGAALEKFSDAPTYDGMNRLAEDLGMLVREARAMIEL